MLYWILDTVGEHPIVAIITALGALLGGVAAIIEARTARRELIEHRHAITDLRERVRVLESKP